MKLQAARKTENTVANSRGGVDTVPGYSPSEFSTADQTISRGVRTLLGVAPSIPTAESLKREIEDAKNAAKRGCFLPDEDERVRAAFARYLGARAVLHSCIAELEPLVRDPESLTERQHLEAFAVAFCAACLLSRSAEFIVSGYARSKVVHRKLDEPEPRFNIPRKQFTEIFNSLTDPSNMWRFQQSIRFAKENEEKLMEFENDPKMGPVLDILVKEKPQLIEFSRRMYFRKRFRYWLYAWIRGHRSSFKQVMFLLFEVAGRAVANMRNPFHLKRVTPEVVAEIRRHLRPGDVVVTRHDDALSNYFLPGFWPHAALYIGTEAERRAIGVQTDGERWDRSADPYCVLEARRDGVLFRQLESTLTVDSFVVIRPQLDDSEVADALSRAMSHEGKYYDFHMDFRRTDRLVCTEVVYRAYHAIGDLLFEPVAGTGRYYVSAEQLLDYAVDGKGFEVVALYGVKGNNLHFGERAEQGLIASYRNS